MKSGYFKRAIPTALIVIGFSLAASGQKQKTSQSKVPIVKEQAIALPFDCGYHSPQFWLDEFQASIDRGEILDPRLKRIPEVAPRQEQLGPTFPCLTRTQIFPYEDSNSILLTNFSFGQLQDLMINATNSVISRFGDNYDFVAFWINFTPHHTIGSAFYSGVENNNSGLGQGQFNNRPELGIGGNNVEGFVMMWNINSSSWQPGTAGTNAKFTRLVLGQEFEHRWGMFLPDLNDGRRLQGDNAGCGRPGHWNFKVDGQGSGMEIREWTGSSSSTLGGDCVSFADDLCFNTDNGGVFSYPDLYLMGYVSPEEMDSLSSELRYMDSSCSSPYGGTISTFDSSDIIQTAGIRNPPSESSQRHFRTAWVMFHLPGDYPSQSQLDKAVGILEQHQIDWNFGTLGRGTMNNTLFNDCNCNGVEDDSECPGDLSPDCPNGEINVDDLLVLIGQWGSTVSAADLNNDGTVNVDDVLILIGEWGPCTAPIGSCCLVDGMCLDSILRLECEYRGGLYRGHATSCTDPTPCPGSCCLVDGNCQSPISSSECSAMAGIWQGVDSTCDATSCPGACCLPNGTCQSDRTLSQCDNVSGIHQGPDTSCQTIVCDRGACCLFDGQCLDDLSEPDCDSQNGSWLGLNTICANDSCPGACCFSDDSCTDDTNPTGCETSGGTWQGLFTTCPGPTCLGACCLEDLTCLDDETLDSCEVQAGSWQGLGTECAFIPPCNPGACCLIDQSCRNLSGEAECNSSGGVWQGDQSSCATSVCSSTTPENDFCVDAIITPVGSHSFSTIGATTDGPDESGDCTFNNYGHIENDVWYRYPSSCDGTVTITLCGADFNSKIAVYFGCPQPGQQPLACSDDDCNDDPQVAFPAASFTIYRVRIGGYLGETGSGTMVISCQE